MMIKQRGMTLISVMVGAIIGGIVVASVFASLSFFQIQRRQMVGGNSSVQGAIAALLEMQRAVKASGGTTMASGRPLCGTINIYNRNVGTLADGRAVSAVAITDGGTGSDTLTLSFASSVLAGVPNRVIAAMPSASSILKLNNGIGLGVGDLVVVGLPGSTLPCTLMQVTQLPVTGFGTDLQHNPGVSAPWNPPNPANVFANAPSYPEGSLVWRVGQFNWLSYGVTGNRLQVTDLMGGGTEVVADQIVAMKVWYGTNDGVNRNIEQWIPATGTWAAPSAVQVAAIRAARIGLVARVAAPQLPPTGTCNATPSATVTLWSGGPTFDLSTLGADWACYTYRTLSMVVPLRNVIYGEGA